MKLFIIAGSSSLAPHIILHELDIAHQLVYFNPKDGTTSDGSSYHNIDALNLVPALELDDGRILTEVAAIVQYLADTHADKGLAPKYGTYERAFMQQWLSYVGTEVHKLFLSFYTQNLTDSEKQNLQSRIYKKLQPIENQLKQTGFIAGEQYTVADAYLYVVLSWAKSPMFDLSPYPSIIRYFHKVGQRPAIQAAIRDESN